MVLIFDNLGDDNILKYLLNINDLKDLIKKKSKIGYSPLHYAVNSDSSLCVLNFIDYNDSDIFNSQDNNGDTPLHIAIRKNNLQIIYFLSPCTDLNISNKKNENLKSLVKNINLKPFIENNFFIY
jgi:ankyrin repeat protein